MNRKLTLPAFALATMVGLSACDLDVANPNQADRERALASPDDVETLISSSFQSYCSVTHHWGTNAHAFNHMSSRHTATWGNFGMNDLGREPREALPNTPSYRWAYVFEAPWQDNYGGISAASDGLAAIRDGLQIGPDGERNERASAFAKFVQGLSACNVALWFDQAYELDEDTDLAAIDPNDTKPYPEFMEFALGKLEEARQLALNNTFTLEEGWINGNPLDNGDFARLIQSYMARCAGSRASRSR